MTTSSTDSRLGIVLSTVTDASLGELVELGLLAERYGFDAVFVNEGRSDALAVSQAIAQATSQITIGTNIANIFFRHPYLIASSTRTIAELSNGRFILGLGMSHRSLLASLGIEMGDGRSALREYVAFVQRALAGEAGEGFMRLPRSEIKTSVFVAANTVESAIIAGAVGDGIMPFLSPLSYLPGLIEAAREARSSAARTPGDLPCILSIPTFIHTDRSEARSAARYNLAFFARLPNYRRQWRRAGFGVAMDELQSRLKSDSRHDLAAVIPDALIDEVCICGPAAECQRQLDAFRRAGADLPVVAVSPVNETRDVATHKAIVALT